jgi:hypothetical protein
MSRLLLNASLMVVLLVGTLPAADPVDFERDVLPVLEQHCIQCHGPDVQESGLRLDSMLFAVRGGDSGERVIQPGQPERSHLMERVTASEAGVRMPPDGELLPAAELELLRRWIAAGADWREAEAAAAHRTSDHWSFQPLTRPAVPVVDADWLPRGELVEKLGADSVLAQLNPIDSFVIAKLHSVDLTLSPLAEKRRRIRRLFLVMHGLPPTPAQVEQFVRDTRPDAWEQWVRHVLDSPNYGERWAAHWLDLVRFGETDGFETNRERPHAFPYRDWVIEAFNTDKPYDQFVRQQLAGDALGEPVATGFLVAGPNDIVKGQDRLLGLMQRQDELTDMVNTTGTAFLGLTTGCARCHNHKFDPITQTDFYALQAVFAGVEHGERELPPPSSVQQRLVALGSQLAAVRAELEAQVGAAPLREPVSALRNEELFAPTPARRIRFHIARTNASEPCIDELEVFQGGRNVALASSGAIARSSGDFVHPLHKLEHINDGQYGNARSWIASTATGGWVELELPQAIDIDRIVWARDREGRYADRVATEYTITVSLDGVSWRTVASSADRVPLGQASGDADAARYDLSSLSGAALDQAQASLERLAALRQARQQLLGVQKAYAGMFRQPEPVHRLHRGDPVSPREQVEPGAIALLGQLELPTGANEQQRRVALADWIVRPDNPLTARVLVNRLWQFHFGTGIVDTPSDFGASGTPPTHPELLDWLASEFIDSGWSIKHMQRLILTSHTWQQDSRPRESALDIDAAARWLWRFPPRRLEAEGIRDCILAASGQLDLRMGGPGFSAFEVQLENVRHYFPKQEFGPEDWRRMVYMTRVRQEKDAIFGVFDCPDGSQVTPKRTRSTTPLQALNLLNGRFVLQQAELFAQRLERLAESDAERVRQAYAWCYSRFPDMTEQAAAEAFIAEHGWVQFARALLNSNEFIFIP